GLAAGPTGTDPSIRPIRSSRGSDETSMGRDVDQSTSMACRPPYQPQLPHTMWGCLAALQRGQTLRDGASSFQAEARRLRLLALDVFFLGTAISVCSLPAAG